MSSQPEPRWSVPNPYGYAAAIDSMGSIAAPLLAGLSVALAVFVMQSGDVFEWASTALLLLVTAAFAFVAALQLTFMARQYAVTPPEMTMWWSNPDETGRREMLRWEQRRYRREHQRWAKRASLAYDVGIMALLAGAVVCLVPNGGLTTASNARIAACVLAAAGLLAELGWIVSKRLDTEDLPADWPPQPGPEFGS
jgi:hypothetical protein